jgi:hypothetical protein
MPKQGHYTASRILCSRAMRVELVEFWVSWFPLVRDLPSDSQVKQILTTQSCSSKRYRESFSGKGQNCFGLFILNLFAKWSIWRAACIYITYAFWCIFQKGIETFLLERENAQKCIIYVHIASKKKIYLYMCVCVCMYTHDTFSKSKNV